MTPLGNQADIARKDLSSRIHTVFQYPPLSSSVPIAFQVPSSTLLQASTNEYTRRTIDTLDIIRKSLQQPPYIGLGL